MEYQTSEKQCSELVKMKIADSDLELLRRACVHEGLNATAWNSLVWWVIRLWDFERNDKPTIKSEKGQLDSLLAVEKAGMALRDAIEKLSNGEAIAVDSRLWRGAEVAPVSNADPLFTYVVTAQRAACAVSIAARQVHADRVAEGADGRGRAKTRSAYAGHIAVLAHHLMEHGIVPGDNGPFRRLCDEGFSIAGIPANSQGAIKYFKENFRPNMKERGQCL